MTGIEIHGDVNSPFLTVSLQDVLPYLQAREGTKWWLLWLEAWGSEDTSDLHDFAEEVRQSADGTPVSTQQVQHLADAPWQIVNLVLLGSTEGSNLHRYQQDEEMYKSCEYVIEVFDSSFLIVHSYDDEFISCLCSKLEGVKTVQ